jgi:hypothetical protein
MESELYMENNCTNKHLLLCWCWSLWVVTSCVLVGTYQRFEETYRLQSSGLCVQRATAHWRPNVPDQRTGVSVQLWKKILGGCHPSEHISFLKHIIWKDIAPLKFHNKKFPKRNREITNQKSLINWKNKHCSSRRVQTVTEKRSDLHF